jgi:hypothetical protein
VHDTAGAWGKIPERRNLRAASADRRAEMWARNKEWLNTGGGVDIPDLDSLHADACGPGYSYDMNQRLQLESKERMRVSARSNK